MSPAKAARPVRGAIIGYGGAFNMGRAHAQWMRDTGRMVPVAVCDQWFTDLDAAVAGPVTGADFYYPAASRSSASDAAWASLVAKGYSMHPF